jgi:hypothetical protein
MEIKAMSQKISAFLLVVLGLVSTTALQTLDMAGFMDTGAMFGNANILLAAFGALIMLVIGFHLAKIIIRFVINMFQNFNL